MKIQQTDENPKLRKFQKKSKIFPKSANSANFKKIPMFKQKVKKQQNVKNPKFRKFQEKIQHFPKKHEKSANFKKIQDFKIV